MSPGCTGFQSNRCRVTADPTVGERQRLLAHFRRCARAHLTEPEPYPEIEPRD
jgi:hypothetical protein